MNLTFELSYCEKRTFLWCSELLRATHYKNTFKIRNVMYFHPSVLFAEMLVHGFFLWIQTSPYLPVGLIQALPWLLKSSQSTVWISNFSSLKNNFLLTRKQILFILRCFLARDIFTQFHVILFDTDYLTMQRAESWLIIPIK